MENNSDEYKMKGHFKRLEVIINHFRKRFYYKYELAAREDTNTNF